MILFGDHQVELQWFHLILYKMASPKFLAGPSETSFESTHSA